MSTSPPSERPKPTQKWVSRMGTAVRRSPSLLSRQTTEPDVPPVKAPAKSNTKNVSASPPPVSPPSVAPAPAPMPEPAAGKPQSGNKLMAKLGAAARRNTSSVSLARVVDSDAASIKTTGSAESTAGGKDQASGTKWTTKLGAAAKRSPSMLSLARPTAASAAKNTDSDTVSLNKSTPRASLAPAAKTTPSRPATPVSTKTAKPAPSPPPALPADAKAKASKNVKGSKLPSPQPSPPATKTKMAPAEAAVEKPKSKWTARVGGAVRRSSSLLSSTKPITASAPTLAAKADVTVPPAASSVPSVILIPQEDDILAESPKETPETMTDIAVPQLTAEPDETVLIDEPVAVVEDVCADSPFENVPEASESVVETAPDVPIDNVTEDEDVSRALPSVDVTATVQILDKVSVPSPISEEEVPRSSSPFDDDVLNEVAPIEAAGQGEVRPVSPFEEVPASSVPVRAEDAVERPTSPFDDIATVPAKVPGAGDIEELVIERPKSLFEDVIPPSDQDKVAGSVSALTTVAASTSQVHIAEAESKPVSSEATESNEPIISAIETEVNKPLEAPATALEWTKPTLTDPAFSAVLLDSRDIHAANSEQTASEHIVSSDSEEHDLTDEDPFADPLPAQPAVTVLKEKDEPWTLVKSYHDDDLDIQVDGHLEVVIADNPWAATQVHRTAVAASEIATVQDEEVDITQPIVTLPDTRHLRAQSVPPTPSPPMLTGLAPRPKTPPAPPTATKSIITPTFGTLPAPSFSTITTPLRALRAPTLPPSAVSAQYHPLAQEEAEESAGYGTSTSTSASNSNSTSGTGSGRSRDESVARSTDGTGAAGSRSPSVPKKDPFADPYPPRQRAGTGPHEEYTPWGSVYEMIAGVFAELLTLSRWIVSRR